MNTLKKLFLFMFATLLSNILIAQNINWDNYQIQDTYINVPGNHYHQYSYATPLCKKSAATGCTLENLFKIFISDSRFIAPTFGRQEVTNGGVLYLLLKLPGVVLPGLHPIKTLIDDQNFTVTNYTLPGHALHPGKAVRKLSEKDGYIYLSTFGEGYSNIGQFITGEEITCKENLKILRLAESFSSFFENMLSDKAAETNANDCVTEYVWGPIHSAFIDRIKNLPPVNDDNFSHDLTDEFIWKSSFPGKHNFSADGQMIIPSDNPSDASSDHRTYIYKKIPFRANEVSKVVIVFYNFLYHDGHQDVSHVSSPIISFSRFSYKDNMWHLEQFIDNFKGLGGAFGQGPTMQFTMKNGKPILKTHASDMHFGNVSVDDIQIDLDTLQIVK